MTNSVALLGVGLIIWWSLPSPVGGDPELDIKTGIPFDSIVNQYYDILLVST